MASIRLKNQFLGLKNMGLENLNDYVLDKFREKVSFSGKMTLKYDLDLDNDLKSAN